MEKNVGETVASLNFAQRVRSVELGPASRRFEAADVGGATETRGRTMVSRCVAQIHYTDVLTFFPNSEYIIVPVGEALNYRPLAPFVYEVAGHVKTAI